MAPVVVTYELDDETSVQFEIEPSADFRPAGAEEIAGRVREAVEPAVASARAVLDRVREIGPNEVTVKFGIKVSGQANWFVAKAATEGNFEVTLAWKAPQVVAAPTPPDPGSSTPADPGSSAPGDTGADSATSAEADPPTPGG